MRGGESRKSNLKLWFVSNVSCKMVCLISLDSIIIH